MFKKGRRLIPICGIICTALITFLYLYKPTYLHFLDYKFYDILLWSSHTDTTPKTSVIVDLDDRSLAEFGQWPWPRYRIALLLSRLKELGAASIALDMIFADPDRTSLDTIQKDVHRDLKININMSQVPKEFMDNDKILAREISRGPFVPGYKFLFDDEGPAYENCILHPINVIVANPSKIPLEDQFLFRGRNPVCNLKILNEAASSTGFINIAFDFDGILRRAPLLIQKDGRFYPSLALAALMKAFPIAYATLNAGPFGIDSLRVGKTVIPLDRRGNLMIKYRGKSKT